MRNLKVRMQSFETEMLILKFEPKKEEISGVWIEVCNEKPHNWTSHQCSQDDEIKNDQKIGTLRLTMKCEICM